MGTLVSSGTAENNYKEKVRRSKHPYTGGSTHIQKDQNRLLENGNC